MVLTPPVKFSLVKRRRHKRKRVIDQQFIRVKLWLGKPDSDDTTFADRIPDLAVNSYDPRSTGHEDNQVINISNGGIGVGASPVLVESKLNIDDDVLISIFMFNFRQKVFKPYWYAGKYVPWKTWTVKPAGWVLNSHAPERCAMRMNRILTGQKFKQD